MKIKLSLLSFILLLSFISFSCGQVKEPDFKGVQNIKFTRFGRDESTLTLELVYFNPNKKKFKLKMADGDAWLDGNLLGHFSVDSLISIPALDTFYIPVNLSLNMKKVLMNSALLLLKNEVILKIDGKARIGKGGIYINYPLKYEEKYRTNELLQLNTDKMKGKEPE